MAESFAVNYRGFVASLLSIAAISITREDGAAVGACISALLFLPVARAFSKASNPNLRNPRLYGVFISGMQILLLSSASFFMKGWGAAPMIVLSLVVGLVIIKPDTRFTVARKAIR